MPKNSQTAPQLHSSHTLVKKCSKFSKPGCNYTWTVNFQMFKKDLEKAVEPEIKLPTSAGSRKKQESSRKTSISALLTMPKTLTVWITRKVNKSIEIILQTYRTVNILFHSLLKALTTFIKQCNMSLRVLLSVFSM